MTAKLPKIYLGISQSYLVINSKLQIQDGESDITSNFMILSDTFTVCVPFAL